MIKYEKTAWVDGETVLKADHMKKIEKGIVDLCTEIENITLEATDLSNYYTKTQTDNKISEEIAKAQLGGSGEVDLSAYATKEYVNGEFDALKANKFDDVSISGDKLSLKANGVTKKTITLPASTNGGDSVNISQSFANMDIAKGTNGFNKKPIIEDED